MGDDSQRRKLEALRRERYRIARRVSQEELDAWRRETDSAFADYGRPAAKAEDADRKERLRLAREGKIRKEAAIGGMVLGAMIGLALGAILGVAVEQYLRG